MSVRSRNAFTAVEVLVIFISVVLVAVVVYPLIAKGREKSRLQTCVSNQMEIAQALLIAAHDNGGLLGNVGTDEAAWHNDVAAKIGTDVFDCPAAYRDGTSTAPEYGLNAYLLGANISKVNDPKSVLLTADAGTNVFRTHDDVDAARHASPAGAGYIVSFVDQSAKFLNAETDHIIFASGDMGTYRAFGAVGLPIIFKDANTARGTWSSVEDGAVVTITSEAAGNITPLISITGSYHSPQDGLSPGVSDLLLEPKTTRAFTLRCCLDDSGRVPVETQYHFGKAPRQVTITVRPPVSSAPVTTVTPPTTSVPVAPTIPN